MRSDLLFVAAAGLIGTGCIAPQNQSVSPDLAQAQTEAARNPSNRFVVAGTREYPNGTEVYVLDGKSGQVCYYFVAKGGKVLTDDALNTDMRACAGEALNPL